MPLECCLDDLLLLLLSRIRWFKFWFLFNSNQIWKSMWEKWNTALEFLQTTSGMQKCCQPTDRSAMATASFYRVRARASERASIRAFNTNTIHFNWLIIKFCKRFLLSIAHDVGREWVCVCVRAVHHIRVWMRLCAVYVQLDRDCVLADMNSYI